MSSTFYVYFPLLLLCVCVCVCACVCVCVASTFHVFSCIPCTSYSILHSTCSLRVSICYSAFESTFHVFCLILLSTSALHLSSTFCSTSASTFYFYFQLLLPLIAHFISVRTDVPLLLSTFESTFHVFLILLSTP
jgi:hypothetical protein